jgi:hypothetical protein
LLGGGLLAVLLLGLALKTLLAWVVLRSEALAVEAALGESLPAHPARCGLCIKSACSPRIHCAASY